mgnify:FL=1
MFDSMRRLFPGIQRFLQLRFGDDLPNSRLYPGPAIGFRLSIHQLKSRDHRYLWKTMGLDLLLIRGNTYSLTPGLHAPTPGRDS